MPLSFVFWMIYILCLFFSLWAHYPAGPTPANWYRPVGAVLAIFVLIGLLGWNDFGAAIHR